MTKGTIIQTDAEGRIDTADLVPGSVVKFKSNQKNRSPYRIVRAVDHDKHVVDIETVDGYDAKGLPKGNRKQRRIAARKDRK